MEPELFPPTLDERCKAARDRIAEFVNRSAGQHLRHIRAGITSAGLRLLQQEISSE